MTFAMWFGQPQNFSVHGLRHWWSQNGYGRLFIPRSRILLHARVPGIPGMLGVQSNIDSRLSHRLRYILLRGLLLFRPNSTFGILHPFRPDSTFEIPHLDVDFGMVDDDNSFPC